MKFMLLNMKDYHKLIEQRIRAYQSANIDYLNNLSSRLYQEQQLDTRSQIFCHSHDGNIVASCRITNLKSTEKEFVNKISQLAPELDVSSTFAISRLCVDKAYQGNHVYRYLLKFACEWAIKNTFHQNYVAVSRTRHLILYARIGSYEIKNSRYYDEIADAEYALVQGNIQQSFDLLG